MAASLEWKAYDRKEVAHTPDWYWAVGIISLSIAVTSVIFNNILFAILVVISTIVLFLRTLQKPREQSYTLTNKGLRINKELNAYTSLESFWVEEIEENPMLIIKPKSLISPLFVVPLSDINPSEVREYLLNFLPEVEHHEPLSKKIMEFLGF